MTKKEKINETKLNKYNLLCNLSAGGFTIISLLVNNAISIAGMAVVFNVNKFTIKTPMKIFQSTLLSDIFPVLYFIAAVIITSVLTSKKKDKGLLILFITNMILTIVGVAKLIYILFC